MESSTAELPAAEMPVSELPSVPPKSSASVLYDLLADSIAEGVLQVDRSGRVRGANRAACTLLDILSYPPPPGRLIGLTVLEATHLRALSELCQEAQQSGTGNTIEVRLVGRSERTLNARAVPIPGDGGCLLILIDRSEILRLQTIRTEFVANVSHELRTPLASIRATAETLVDGAMKDPEYAERFLQNIIREADRLVRLSADLLELSRAESTERQYSRFDLRFLASEVATRLMSYAERRGVSVELPGSGKPIMVTADFHEIDQVMFNLMDNAIKYTPEGGSVVVTLSEDRNTHEAVIAVSDTGIGILSQDLPRIFERFWRADRARRFQSGSSGSETGGTGLGLSIVKQIVEAHRGTVSAESELGQGSRFTVRLPLATDGNEGAGEPTASGASPEITFP
ncbi:MAG: hypothetical protein OHK0029_31850 [Armatimonadaceae bacterium]